MLFALRVRDRIQGLSKRLNSIRQCKVIDWRSAGYGEAWNLTAGHVVDCLSSDEYETLRGKSRVADNKCFRSFPSKILRLTRKDSDPNWAGGKGFSKEFKTASSDQSSFKVLPNYGAGARTRARLFDVGASTSTHRQDGKTA